MRSLITLTAALILSSISLGQGIAPQIDVPTVEQRIAQLEEGLARIERRLTPGLAAPRPESEPAPVDEQSFRQQMLKFKDATNLRLDAIEEKLDQVGKGDQSQYVPDLSAMALKPALREDFFRAANGRFEVHNQVDRWMSVKLNGQRWRFPPGISSIHIPFSVVQVELVDGGDRHTFNHDDWRIAEGEHLLRMAITDLYPRQE